MNVSFELEDQYVIYDTVMTMVPRIGDHVAVHGISYRVKRVVWDIHGTRVNVIVGDAS